MNAAAETRPTTGRLPDFLLIGAMKSGSTTLWGHLASHPGIFMCRPKEPQFFSREPSFAKGLDWYRSLFSAARHAQICGEASTCYSRWPHFGDVAGRIAQHLPQVKLVYLVRHPVERAYSHYQHLMDERWLSESEPPITFEAAIDSIPEIVDASCYTMQLERFLLRYPREGLHVIVLDDLRANPGLVWSRLQDFLNVTRAPLTPHRGAAVDNPAGDRLARLTARKEAQRILETGIVGRACGLVPRLQQRILGRLERSDLVRRHNARHLEAYRALLSPLSPAARARLLKRFDRPTRELEGFLQRRLTGWLE